MGKNRQLVESKEEIPTLSSSDKTEDDNDLLKLSLQVYGLSELPAEINRAKWLAAVKAANNNGHIIPKWYQELLIEITQHQAVAKKENVNGVEIENEFAVYSRESKRGASSDLHNFYNMYFNDTSEVGRKFRERCAQWSVAAGVQIDANFDFEIFKGGVVKTKEGRILFRVPAEFYLDAVESVTDSGKLEYQSKHLGAGAQGIAKLVLVIDDKAPNVGHVIKRQTIEEFRINELQHESAIAAQLDMGAEGYGTKHYDKNRSTYLHQAYIPGVNLDTVLRDFKSSGYKEKDRLKIAFAMLVALDKFHNRGLIHRDIKPSNMKVHAGKAHGDIAVTLFDLETTVKLSEARDKNGSIIITSNKGTPGFMAQECYGARLEDSKTIAYEQATKIDIYALGQTLRELFGIVNTGENQRVNPPDKIPMGQIPTSYSNHPTLSAFCNALTEQNPRLRPTLPRALEMYSHILSYIKILDILRDNINIAPHDAGIFFTANLPQLLNLVYEIPSSRRHMREVMIAELRATVMHTTAQQAGMQIIDKFCREQNKLDEMHAHQAAQLIALCEEGIHYYEDKLSKKPHKKVSIDAKIQIMQEMKAIFVADIDMSYAEKIKLFEQKFIELQKGLKLITSRLPGQFNMALSYFGRTSPTGEAFISVINSILKGEASEASDRLSPPSRRF